MKVVYIKLEVLMREQEKRIVRQEQNTYIVREPYKRQEIQQGRGKEEPDQKDKEVERENTMNKTRTRTTQKRVYRCLLNLESLFSHPRSGPSRGSVTVRPTPFLQMNRHDGERIFGKGTSTNLTTQNGTTTCDRGARDGQSSGRGRGRRTPGHQTTLYIERVTTRGRGRSNENV